MTVTATAPARPTRAVTTFRIVAAALLLGWVCVLAALAVTGERDASWGSLSDAVRSGQVDHVTVVGSLGFEDPTIAGSAVVEVHWRDHLMMRKTTVEERLGFAPEQLSDHHVIQDPVSQELHQLAPDLRITSEQYSGGASMPVLGLMLNGRAAEVAFVLGVATLFLLVLGPEPERATRWAWFWLFSACPPLACPAYLVLGGMTKRLPMPKAKRLTGGWAFLIALVLGGAT